MTNIIDMNTRLRLVSGLVEGSSIRSLERQTGVHRDTVMRLALRVGMACEFIAE